jgi:hypothetical protein
MCKCAKQIGLKDQQEEETENTKDIQYNYQLMHHPLCKKLMQLKWRQFGLPLFLTSFLIYCLYLILFTAIMLRNKQPEYFYRLVNASFPNSRYSNGTQLVRFLFSKSNLIISFLIDLCRGCSTTCTIKYSRSNETTNRSFTKNLNYCIIMDTCTKKCSLNHWCTSMFSSLASLYRDNNTNS